LESYNPAIRAALLRTAATAAEDEAVLAMRTAAAIDSVVLAVSVDWIEMDAAGLNDQPPGIRSRLLRWAMEQLAGHEPMFNHGAAMRIVPLLAAETGSGQVDLGGGIAMVREYERAWIVRSPERLPFDRWPQVSGEIAIGTAGPGRFALGSGWSLVLGDADGPHNADCPYEAWLAPSAARAALHLRGRRAGERFRPAGMAGGRVRIADAMINWKLPKRLRDGWPLLVSGDRVVWIAGFATASGCDAAPGSEGALRVRLCRD